MHFCNKRLPCSCKILLFNNSSPNLIWVQFFDWLFFDSGKNAMQTLQKKKNFLGAKQLKPFPKVGGSFAVFSVPGPNHLDRCVNSQKDFMGKL